MDGWTREAFSKCARIFVSLRDDGVHTRVRDALRFARTIFSYVAKISVVDATLFLYFDFGGHVFFHHSYFLILSFL